jgi:SAM-dependent methyltransferase
MGSSVYEHDGYCPICKTNTRFVWTNKLDRDSLLCTSCPSLSVPRERAMMLVLDRERPDWRELAIHESSPTDRGVSKVVRQECKRYIATQLMKGVELGTEAHGFRCENLERQTFDTEIFDIVVSLDVMEHVNEPQLALTEIARTLKPGGLYLFTAPTYKSVISTYRKSRYDEHGHVHFVGEPEYHGNPVDPDGSAVTFHYGYDFPELISSWTGFDVDVIRFWDHEHGIIGDMTEVYVCRKPSAARSAAQRSTDQEAPSSNATGKGQYSVNDISTKFGSASEERWLSLLQRSVVEPYIEGVEFPRFPHSGIQNGFNGAVDAEAMLRAHGFWLYPTRWAKALGTPLGHDDKVLDVGCGWGRITRTFMRDIKPENLFGCDIDAEAVSLCRYLGVPGQFAVTPPGKSLPYADNFFSVVAATSVFTHLPENVAHDLLKELSRVTKPGGLIVFTVEDHNFFDYFDIPGIEQNSERWRLLCRHKNHIPKLRKKFANGDYIYLTTNEESVRSSDVYGDALIPKGWFEKKCAKYFELLAYNQSAPPVYQAVVVGRKR